jgi:hypothetical protein
MSHYSNETDEVDKQISELILKAYVERCEKALKQLEWLRTRRRQIT